MKIVIAGGHGKIALLLSRVLSSRGHDVTGLIRSAEQAEDLAAAGATAAVVDLESVSETELAQLLSGAQVAVFAAGAGPNSGTGRKDTVDRGAAVLLADAAEAAGVGRLIQISSMGSDSVRDGARPEGIDDDFYAYLQAKLAAEDDLKARTTLHWTIVRPGPLTDEPAGGQVELAASVKRGTVAREDVAAVLAEIIENGAAARTQLELAAGDDLVATAVARFV